MAQRQLHPYRFVARCSAAAAFGALLAPASAATPSTWVSPTSGTWIEPARWSTNPFYPNNGNPSGATYDVVIDPPAPGVTVTLPALPPVPITIDSLTLGSATVSVDSSATFTVQNDLTMQNGTVSLRRATSARSTLQFGEGTSQISGTGTVRFDVQNPLGGFLLADHGTLSLGAGVTVRTGDGSGRLGAGDFNAVVNHGTVSAQTPGRFLAIHAATFTNNGTLRVGDGTLALGYSFTPQTLGNLVVTGGSLVHAGTLTLGGGSFSVDGYGGGSRWFINGGRVYNGTLHASQPISFGPADFSSQSTLLDRVTLDADATVTTDGVLVFQNGLTLADRTIDVAGRLFASAPVGSFQTMGGTGTILLRNGASIDQFSDATAPQWEIGAGITIDATGTFATLTGPLNRGTVRVDAPHERFTLDGPWRNGGTIALSAGRLRLRGLFAQSAVGNLVRTGGMVAIAGGFQNGNATLSTDAGPLAPFVLENGQILGGRVAGTAPLVVEGVGALIGVGTLSAPAEVDAATLRVIGGVNLDGARITLRSGRLTFDDNGPLGGTGTVVLDGTGDASRIELNDGQDVLEIGPGVTIRTGPQLDAAIISSAVNRGRIVLDTPGAQVFINGATFDNRGEVRVANGADLRLGGESVSNAGSISVDGARLRTASSLTSALINSVAVANDASVTLGGAITNAGATLALRPGARWELTRGRVTGGTIAVTAGVDARVGYLARLDGVALDGELLVTDTVEINNDLTLAGATVRLGGPGESGNGRLYFAGPGTSLRGTGVVEFDAAPGAGGNVHNYAGTLLIEPGITIRTGAGNGVVGQIDQPIENHGQVRAAAAGRTLRVYGPLVTNHGTLAAAPGAVMRLESRLVNAGTVEVDGTVVNDYNGASPVDDMIAQLRTGYADGLWTDGPAAITSPAARAAATAPRPTAIGVAEATDLFTAFPATFRGQEIDSTTVLLQYTLYGDANLDGAVNLKDFNVLAANFGQTGRRWSQGDFTYGGAVTLIDFNLLAANFGYAAEGPDLTPQDWANLAAVVPEPAQAGLGLCAAALVTRFGWRARGRCAART